AGSRRRSRVRRRAGATSHRAAGASRPSVRRAPAAARRTGARGPDRCATVLDGDSRALGPWSTAPSSRRRFPRVATRRRAHVMRTADHDAEGTLLTVRRRASPPSTRDDLDLGPAKPELLVEPVYRFV